LRAARAILEFDPRFIYRHPVRSRRFFPLLFLVLCTAPLLAQEPAEQIPGPLEPCAGGVISYVFIDNKSIFDTADPDLDQRFLWAYRTANALHVRTKEWVIRRELLFGPGSCYDPFVMEETERLLRGYDFLSRVDVFGIAQPDGTWHVIVSTHDEWSTRVDVRFSSTGTVGIEGVRISEENLLGTGQSLGLFYFQREVTRDYGISYFTPQLAGTRWDLTAAVGRTRAGTVVNQEVVYPFLGEIGRWAARQGFRRDEQFFEYIAGDDPQLTAPHVLLPVREQAFDIALVRRLGQLGNTALIGAALGYQDLSYPGPIEVAADGDFDAREPAPEDLVQQVRRQRQEISNLRAFALVGHRNVWWVRRQGLDSMRGQEDVRLGAEALLALGRSLPSIEVDDDLYAMLGLYSAFEVGEGLFVARGRADARRDLEAVAGTPEWEDVYVEAEVMAYLQSARLPRQTLFFRAAGVGAWHTRTPFQLTLGGVHALRGYDRERLPGGRRLVFTVEDRIFFGWPLPALLDIGGTVFADVGRIWRGDAPFGTDSGWRASAGVGLRGSFPAGSRSTYRVDVAWPIERSTAPRDFRVTVSIGEFRGLTPREADLQFTRSRTRSVGGDLITFRN
jgi:hypothetical protein